MTLNVSTFNTGSLGGVGAVSAGGEGSVRPPIQPGVSQQAAAETTVDSSTADTFATASSPTTTEATAMNNPLYAGTGRAGQNPLHKSSFTDGTKPLVNLTGK